MTEKVLTEKRGHTWVVTINRPEVRNCVDGETANGLFEAVEHFRQDAGLYVLVLTGAPPRAGESRAFCAGADLKNIGTLTDRPNARDTGPMGISRITGVGKPTIAAVEGYCVAGGLELACWCDFRIAGAGAQFGVLNRRWGVPLVDGGTVRLPRIVGLGNALYLIETGALIDARRALRMGLVQEVVPEGTALDRALAIAEAMAGYPQTAIRNDRQAALEGLAQSIDAALVTEARIHRDTAASPEMAEWLRRFARGERPAPIEPAGE
jgi:enoyl-CoA hydratase